ncbi:MAG: molecular chaperone HtpG, partial [Acidobacteriota bacterium]
QQLTSERAKDAHLIGQFGVGFYSGFIVADHVTLVTRRAGLTAEHGVRWESTGEGSYTVETVAKAERGTDVILHLRPDEDELLSGHRLRDILRKYSDHIAIPILMKKEQWDAEAGQQVIAADDEQVNRASALWARPKSEITEEQYHELYRHVAHDSDAPLAYTHAKVEGRQEFTLLLYLPARAPFDLWDREHRRGVKLYVRRVFIMDDAEQLLPVYLRFVRGVVDSNDLPLNVSREILQQSKDVQAIRTAAVKRVLTLLEELAEKDPAKYQIFWNTFGRVLKEGIPEDHANRERLTTLLRFSSTHHADDQQTVSLADYAGRMKDGQNDIYYITADGYAAARNSPHLEIFRKLGIEVLLLHERIDEWVAPALHEFGGKRLLSAAAKDLDLSAIGGTPPTPDAGAPAGEYAPLLERMQAALKDRASAVRVTNRLTDSPACLISGEDGLSTHLERMLKAAGQAVPASKPILEVNATHPIVRRLADEADPARFNDWSQILFDQATLAEGGHVEDPAAFVKRLNALLLTLAGTAPSPIWTPGT